MSCGEKAQALLATEGDTVTLDQAKITILSDGCSLEFCGDCAWRQSGISCDDKVAELVKSINSMTLEDARYLILTDCARSRGLGPDANYDDSIDMDFVESGADEEQGQASGISTGETVGIIVLAIIILVLASILAIEHRHGKRLEEELELLRKAQENRGPLHDVENPDPLPPSSAVAAVAPAVNGHGDTKAYGHATNGTLAASSRSCFPIDPDDHGGMRPDPPTAEAATAAKDAANTVENEAALNENGMVTGQEGDVNKEISRSDDNCADAAADLEEMLGEILDGGTDDHANAGDDLQRTSNEEDGVRVNLLESLESVKLNP